MRSLPGNGSSAISRIGKTVSVFDVWCNDPKRLIEDVNRDRTGLPDAAGMDVSAA